MIGFLLLFALAAPAFAGGKPYLPSPVPVNIKPSASVREGKWTGVGFNLVTVRTPWVDEFFGDDQEVGKLKVTGQHLAVGWIRQKTEDYTDERAVIAGRLKMRSTTPEYFSPSLGKRAATAASGDGFNIGMRWLRAWSLGRSERVDWNLALNLHASLFQLDSDYGADSYDGLDSSHYRSSETGLFLRPGLAFQPILALGRDLSVVPYVGTTTMAILSTEQWETTRRRQAGLNRPFFSERIDSARIRGLDLVFGFDVGLVSPFSREHQMTLGAALSQLYGDSDKEFAEFHFLYSMPLSARKALR